ncbi:MAG: OmpW family protein [Gammaproteobacteria bacterium]|nr:OmpW family protein [Gammaproteobacteria bacterium]
MKNSLKRALPAAIALSLGLTAMPAAAYEAGDWIVRARLITVNPDESSSAIATNGADVAGSGVSVDNDLVPELDFTYMMSPHWGLELILGTSEHDINATGTLKASLGQIGEAKVLPPTLTLQYHFAPSSNIRPYAGVGINYTHFYSENATGAIEGSANTDLDLDDSWGLAAQAGVDIDINKEWFINFDVKYIDISTKATFKNTATLGTVTADVDIDPWVFGIGIGTTF